ncbi:MAG: hypothetical protein EZS28_031809, partial [Streblomastix strix]
KKKKQRLDYLRLTEEEQKKEQKEKELKDREKELREREKASLIAVDPIYTEPLKQQISADLQSGSQASIQKQTQKDESKTETIQPSQSKQDVNDFEVVTNRDEEGKGKRVFGISKYLDDEVPYKTLFLQHKVILVGHAIDFGKYLAQTVRLMLSELIEIALRFLETAKTIQLGDLLLSVSQVMHYDIGKVAGNEQEWEELIWQLKGKQSAIGISTTVSDGCIIMCAQELAEQYILNLINLQFIRRKEFDDDYQQYKEGTTDISTPYDRSLHDIRVELKKAGQWVNYGDTIVRGLSHGFAEIYAIKSQSFSTRPHMSILVKWMSQEEVLALVFGICDQLSDLMDEIVRWGAIVASCIPFMGRKALGNFDASGNRIEEIHAEIRGIFRRKQQAVQWFEQFVTKLGNMLGFVLQLDSALGFEKAERFLAGAGLIAYGLRASDPSRQKLPEHEQRFIHNSGNEKIENDTILSSQGTLIGALQHEGIDSALSVAAMVASNVMQRSPFFKYVIQRLLQVIQQMQRQGFGEYSLEENKYKVIESFSSQTYQPPRQTVYKRVLNQWGGQVQMNDYTQQDQQNKGIMGEDEAQLTHAKMIYEVFNGILDQTLYSLRLQPDYGILRYQNPQQGKKNKESIEDQINQKGPNTDEQSSDLGINPWKQHGDGLWLGMCAVIAATGQRVPFEATWPLNVTRMAVHSPVPQTLYENEALMKQLQYLGCVKEAPVGVLGYQGWAEKLRAFVQHVFQIVDSSIILSPISQIPFYQGTHWNVDGTQSVQLLDQNIRYNELIQAGKRRDERRSATQDAPNETNSGGLIWIPTESIPAVNIGLNAQNIAKVGINNAFKEPAIPSVQRPSWQIRHSNFNFLFNQLDNISQQQGLSLPPASLNLQSKSSSSISTSFASFQPTVQPQPLIPSHQSLPSTFSIQQAPSLPTAPQLQLNKNPSFQKSPSPVPDIPFPPSLPPAPQLLQTDQLQSQSSIQPFRPLSPSQTTSGFKPSLPQRPPNMPPPVPKTRPPPGALSRQGDQK